MSQLLISTSTRHVVKRKLLKRYPQYTRRYMAFRCAMHLLPLDHVSKTQLSTNQNLFAECANSQNDRWTCILPLDIVSPCIVWYRSDMKASVSTELGIILSQHQIFKIGDVMQPAFHFPINMCTIWKIQQKSVFSWIKGMMSCCCPRKILILIV